MQKSEVDLWIEKLEDVLDNTLAYDMTPQICNLLNDLLDYFESSKDKAS